MTFRTLLVALAIASVPLSAQEAPDAAEKVDIITPHITDSYHLEVPYWKPPFAQEVCIGRKVSEEECLPLWAPVHIGGRTVQLSPTKHVVFMLLAAFLCIVILVGAARAHVRQTQAIGRPKGTATGIEAMVLGLQHAQDARRLGEPIRLHDPGRNGS